MFELGEKINDPDSQGLLGGLKAFADDNEHQIKHHLNNFIGDKEKGQRIVSKR